MKRSNKVTLIVVCLATLGLLAAVSAEAQTGVMFVKNNRVGIGNANPSQLLQVTGSGGAQVLVEDTTGAGAKSMFVLKNVGSTKFELQNTNFPDAWFFSANNSNNFVVSLFGTGGSEVSVAPNGNMTVRGTVTANGVLLTSSKEAKADFSPVDTHTVLDKVAALPLNQWRFKTEDESIRHVGPFAEDFYQAFGLGDDDRRISMTDAAGVALAAIQGLHEKVESLEAERDELRLELAELRTAVAAISK